MSEFANNQAYTKYLGLAALLGRIAGRARLSSEDKGSLEHVFADVNAAMVSRNSELEFKKTHDGGYATFERKA